MDEVSPSEFEGRDFDSREFVQRYRKRLPLKELQKCLRSQHAATRQELVELINEKYADFVSLSSRMQGVERALKPLRAPLEESSELTKSLHSKLGGLLGQADEANKTLSGIRSRKEALTLYIQNAKLLDKAKAASEQRWGNPQESDDFLREHVVHEQIARDLRRIRLNLGGKPRVQNSPVQERSSSKESSAPEPKASDEASCQEEAPSPECAALLQEAADFEGVFAGRLRQRLDGLAVSAKRSLSSSSDDSAGDSSKCSLPRSELLAIAHVCRALVTLGRADVIEGVFADIFVKSAIDAATAACTSGTEDSYGGGTSAGGAPSAAFAIGFGAPDLGPFFDKVKAALLSKDSPLLWIARCLRGQDTDDVKGTLLAVPSLHLVANVGVMPVLRHVQQVWPNVFMPAPPDIFASNYAHANSYVKACQEFMAPAERRAFLQGSALTDFQKRWKTQVYFSLRAKEANQLLDVASTKASPSDSRMHTVGGSSYWMEASAELVRLIQTVWSERWYLDVVYSKLLQLSLELLGRYHKTVQGLAGDASDAAGAEKAWDAGAASPSWAPTSVPVRLSKATTDVCTVLVELSALTQAGSLACLIVEKAPGGSDGRPAEIAKALLQEAQIAMRPVLEVLEAAIQKQVSAAVAPQFASVKGIPALFRVVDRPVPSKASAYVEPAMRPIQALAETGREGPPPDIVAKWIHNAVDAAADEFSAQASQLIDSTQQQQASLQRLADRTAGGAAAAVSNFDKMHIQLCLDVESFTAAASALGVDVAQSKGLSKLAEAVSKVSGTMEAHRIRSG